MVILCNIVGICDVAIVIAIIHANSIKPCEFCVIFNVILSTCLNFYVNLSSNLN